MAGNKDEPLPESTMRLIWESKAAQDEEWRRQEEWIEHYNSTYPREQGEATPVTAYRIAARIVEAYEAGQLGDAHDETPGLAQAYIDAIRKRQDAMSIATAEFAVSHPELLDELNRDL